MKGNIDKIKRIQNRAVRLITKDYKSRERGSITNMRKDLELETLEERRSSLRLILMYKVVEGLVQSLPTDQFVNFAKPKRQIKTKTPKDFHVENILDKHVCNNTKALTIPTARSKQYINSFFVKTAIDWNHLPDAVAQAGTPEAFKTALKEHRQQ
jgi:Zn-dependent M16 (insulinase) family peptidase